MNPRLQQERPRRVCVEKRKCSEDAIRESGIKEVNEIAPARKVRLATNRQRNEGSPSFGGSVPRKMLMFLSLTLK